MLITFEGGEGAGKTTQIHLLSKALEDKGYSVVLVREPGGTLLGEAIRDLLKSPSMSICPEAELSLFIAARSQLVRSVIQPALKEGKIIICDRFIDSTTVYQGMARALDPLMVKSMNAWAICNCQPDITFFLQVSTEEGLARLAKRGEALDPIELESNNFHQKIQEGYLFLAKNEPQRFIVLAGNQSIDTLAAAILETVMKKIAKKGEND